MPQRKYPLELRERAVRLVLDADPAACRGVFRRLGGQLGVNQKHCRPGSTRTLDAGDRPGTTTANAQRIKNLEEENGTAEGLVDFTTG